MTFAHLQRELVHEVDLVRVGDVTVLEVLHRHGESCAEEADLPLSLAVVHQLFQHGLELGRKELISLKKNTHTRTHTHTHTHKRDRKTKRTEKEETKRDKNKQRRKGRTEKTKKR